MTQNSSLNLIFSVSEFNEVINRHLKLLKEVVVEGEISQLSISQGKWLFMTIKDSRSNASVFAPAFRISGVNALEEGMKVHVYGVPGLHQKSGRFNLTAHRIVPSGEGALRLAYEKLKSQLQEEGLFDPARKRTLPRFPEKIGLITSVGARAYSDFIKVTSERMGGLKIYFYPVNVQGRDSVSSILKAFEHFNQLKYDLDAIVITRGGGSLEDLISFNDESVARAIFSSKFPVVSAIGHEEDMALTDFVADVRASTPSNAAELLVMSRKQISVELDHLSLKINNNMTDLLSFWKDKINNNLLFFESFIEKQINIFENLREKLVQNIVIGSEKISLINEKAISIKKRLFIQLENLLESTNKKIDNAQRLLNSYDHNQVLKRGYSISKTIDGKLLRSISQVEKGQEIKTILSDGELQSNIINKEKHAKTTINE